MGRFSEVRSHVILPKGGASFCSWDRSKMPVFDVGTGQSSSYWIDGRFRVVMLSRSEISANKWLVRFMPMSNSKWKSGRISEGIFLGLGQRFFQEISKIIAPEIKDFLIRIGKYTLLQFICPRRKVENSQTRKGLGEQAWLIRVHNAVWNGQILYRAFLIFDKLGWFGIAPFPSLPRKLSK